MRTPGIFGSLLTPVNIWLAVKRRSLSVLSFTKILCRYCLRNASRDDSPTCHRERPINSDYSHYELFALYLVQFKKPEFAPRRFELLFTKGLMLFFWPKKIMRFKRALIL